MRKFGNGTEEHTLYDDAGRVTVKMQKSDRGKLLWGEGYAYAEDGKRTATVDNLGRVTLYEYNSKGQLASVYYPYTDEMVKNLKEEAQLNGLPDNADAGENRYLSSETRTSLIPLLNSMQYGLSYNLTNLHIFIKESYLYDKNGNRKSKVTPYGSIEYSYDKENMLLSSGSKGQSFVNYTYDAMGNLLTEESADKTVKYAYNAQNRLIYCEITDRINKEYGQTTYAYDAFGRRIIVQDKGEAVLRTLYDGLTFDVIKQSPTFASGMFTDSNETGIRWGKTGKPTGDRYRYISDEDSQDSNRYFYLDDGTYKTVSTRYRGERTQISVNGTLATQSTSDYGAEYFSTDLLGSIRTTTDSYGTKKSGISYDAFGSLVEGELSSTSDFGYLGKQQDPATRLYNYGYRDYKPQTARFTTLDPIRDGTNWFTYCNGDPVNFIDLWGLCEEEPNLAGVPPQYRNYLIEQYKKNKEKESHYQWPLDNNEVTSEYGLRNDVDPNQHDGLDLRAKKGTPVYAMADGEVSLADLEYAGSNSKSSYLIIQGTDDYEQRYLHMDSFNVKVGDKVSKGQLIGYTGNRTNAQEHLHVEIRKGKEKINPREILPPL